MSKIVRKWSNIAAVLCTVMASTAATIACALASVAKSTSDSVITVDNNSSGPVFDGIGAISGGGGQTRYLSDYSAQERDEMYKLLFAPNYGASLQILKVEIGGNANSTDGAEPSIENTRGVVNCNVGFEWQFMEKAKACNPAIKFSALGWSAPGWIHNYFSRTMISYLMTWLDCAKQHGLSIDYIGGWNEHPFNSSQSWWFVALRNALDQLGYSKVEIVGSDEFPTYPKKQYNPASTWDIAKAMATNRKLNAAISIIGAHDICGYPTDGLSCCVTPTARSLHKPLWASELGHMDRDTGAADMVRALNRGFIDGGLTGFILWPIMIAMPPGLPHENFGLITADQPWSGHYRINEMMWAIAQTTQFTSIGWRYIPGANGYFAGNRSNGSYVTLRSNTNNDWSMIAETTTATSPREITVKVRPGLSQNEVHVYATNLRSSNSFDWFVHAADLKMSDDEFHYLLEPGYVYTFSTTTGQSKGGQKESVPARKSFPLPYSDTFSELDSSGQARYLSTMDGAFEAARCQGGMNGMCLQQMAPEAPIYWRKHPGYPYAIIGDGEMSNYTIAVKLLFQSPHASGGVIGRFSNQRDSIAYFDGYLLHVSESGAWKIIQNNAKGGLRVLRRGQVPALAVDKWHTISLTLDGSSLFAKIDGVQVGTATSTAYRSGPAGIEAGAFTGTWPLVQYRNLSIIPVQGIKGYTTSTFAKSSIYASVHRSGMGP